MEQERRRDATNVVIRDKTGEILLFRRDNKPGIPYPDFYDAIGGVVDAGETPEQGAIREAHEEAGVVLDPAKLRLVVVYKWPNQTEYNYVYTEPLDVNTAAWVPTEGQGIEWHTPGRSPISKDSAPGSCRARGRASSTCCSAIGRKVKKQNPKPTIRVGLFYFLRQLRGRLTRITRHRTMVTLCMT
ncbi:MAG: NUDIX hydrolase [Patescibacteria group bacterium]|mgnify:CR=1 FL=1